MPLYDFVCRDGHTTEAVRGYEVSSIPCPLCGESAYRCEVNHVSFQMRDADTEVKDRKGRYHVSRFKEAADEIDYEYTKVEKKEGREVKAPSFYKAGLKEAKRRGAKLRV